MRLTTPGYLGLIAGIAGLIWYLNFGPGAPASQAQTSAPGSFQPAEQIGIDQPVEFPVDI